ncbi:MAG: methionine adenosyltransferase [Phycisphaerales bacterium]|nr:methionine adenosyltransferase [Phycisphaerae bacterium]NNF42522.1 methionine adenosyltransferase [Phycisphaerales bacterium]NNM26524.1 methionine adenosyltransferase [Phycisphaerales bacterium]
MSAHPYQFTSESVSMGHPDKMADQISDAVLDAMLAEDPNSRVACETMVTTGMALVAGEVTCDGYVDIAGLIRRTVLDIGYDDGAKGFDGASCAVVISLDQQSPDIAMGVNQTPEHEQGAGDQGLMFGYACRETETLMPLPIDLSHRLMATQADVRRSSKIPHLRPDAKGQVTVEYEGNTPRRVSTVVLSTQHGPEWNENHDGLAEEVTRHIIKPVLGTWWNDDIVVHVNPTGRFEIGGPHGDCGLTGRKIIVDTYGGRGRHGGGAFSGKDPTKVDRSAAYMARYIAKNIVAADLAEVCEVQLSYAIGVPAPTSVHVDTQGTNRVDEQKLAALVRDHFDLTPRGIIESLDLLRPIYRPTAAHGHFGRSPDEGIPGTFTWERTDLAAKLKNAATHTTVATA